MTAASLGNGSTTKWCPECGKAFPGILQIVGGAEIAVGACPDCFAAPPKKADPRPVKADDTPLDIGTTTVEKQCQKCGETYTAATIMMGGRPLNLGRFCEACSETDATTAASRRQAAFVAAREREWCAICPEGYRSTGVVAALPKEKLEAVREAYKKSGGILVHGKQSGIFKTTAVFHGVIKRLIWDRERVAVITASEWVAKASEAAKDCKTEVFLRPFASIPHLFLDDVGQMGRTPAGIAALQGLLEKRNAKMLPVIATTQFSGRALFERLLPGADGSEEVVDALVRRLSECCRTTIKFQ